jgi:hypothetical protein
MASPTIAVSPVARYTVRVDRPGRHVVELRINGAAVAHAAFTLRAR